MLIVGTKVTIDGVEMEVIYATESQAKIIVGPHEVTFRENGAKVIKAADFFIPTGSSEDIPPLTDDLFKPALQLAYIVIRDHRQRRQKAKERSQWKQLTLPGIM